MRAQHITLAVGKSLPYGLYSSTDYLQTSPGMAMPGMALSVTGEDGRFSKYIWPYLQFTYNTNPIDQNAIDEVYKLLKYRGAQVYRPWTQLLLMGGAKFTYQSERYELYAKTGIAMGWMSTYGYNIYSDSVGIIKFNSLSQNALTLMAGIGASVYVLPNVSLCAGYDFYYARPNFGYEKYTNALGAVRAAVAVEVKPALTLGNLYAGVRFQLPRNKFKK